MDALCDPDIRELILMFSTQVGKTELLLNAICYHVHIDPCTMLLVEPDLILAETMSKNRVAAAFKDCPALRGKVKEPRTRDSGNTLLEKIFPGGYLAISGANSPASLANRAIRKLFMDETDRYKPTPEGDPQSLAEKRTANFKHNKQIVRVSSPSKSEKDATSIAAHYKRSDQRKYYVPCPHCGFEQIFKLAFFKYEVRKDVDDQEQVVPESVTFTCGSCSQAIKESHKAQMLARGRWIAENPTSPIRGYWLNEFYSPWKGWDEIIQDYLSKKDDPQTLKVFTNSSLAEVTDDKGEAPPWQELYDRRENYRIGSVPRRALFLTAAADVQGGKNSRIEVEVTGWGRGKESWSIEHHVFEGDVSTEDSEPWKKLEEVLYSEFEHESGVFLPITRMAVDRNFLPSVVDAWVRKHKAKAISVRGQEDLPSPTIGARTVDARKDGKKVRRGMRYWPVGTTVIKDETYAWLQLEAPESFDTPRPCFCHFPEYPQEYFKQLTAESKKPKRVKGQNKNIYAKDYERNEVLDLRVYNRAAAHSLGMDRWPAKKWEDLEAAVRATKKKAGPEAPSVTAPEPKPAPKPAAPQIIWKKGSFDY